MFINPRPLESDDRAMQSHAWRVSEQTNTNCAPQSHLQSSTRIHPVLAGAESGSLKRLATTSANSEESNFRVRFGE